MAVAKGAVLPEHRLRARGREELRALILEALPLIPGRFVKENPDSADNWEAIITIRRRDRDDVADICRGGNSARSTQRV